MTLICRQLCNSLFKTGVFQPFFATNIPEGDRLSQQYALLLKQCAEFEQSSTLGFQLPFEINAPHPH